MKVKKINISRKELKTMLNKAFTHGKNNTSNIIWSEQYLENIMSSIDNRHFTKYEVEEAVYKMVLGVNASDEILIECLNYIHKELKISTVSDNNER